MGCYERADVPDKPSTTEGGAFNGVWVTHDYVVVMRAWWTAAAVAAGLAVLSLAGVLIVRRRAPEAS